MFTCWEIWKVADAESDNLLGFIQGKVIGNESHQNIALQARNDVQTNPETILSVWGRTNPEPI